MPLISKLMLNILILFLHLNFLLMFFAIDYKITDSWKDMSFLQLLIFNLADNLRRNRAISEWAMLKILTTCLFILWGHRFDLLKYFIINIYQVFLIFFSILDIIYYLFICLIPKCWKNSQNKLFSETHSH